MTRFGSIIYLFSVYINILFISLFVLHKCANIVMCLFGVKQSLHDIFGDVFEYVSSWALVICLLQTICVILELVVTGYVILYQSHSQNRVEQCLNIYVKSGPNNWVKRKQSRLESGPLQTTEYP